jgi:membrane-associated protein
MDLLKQFIDIFLHLNQHLNELAAQMGGWLNVLLFAIIFCETGLVVTPFLPGDSLLFAVGALAATEGSPIQIAVVVPLLIVAGILGDAVNYAIGRYFGERLFTGRTSKFLKREHLDRTHAFYEKYGGQTIILARFIPIVRTFAPFVAGMGKMGYTRFGAYNVVGAIAWVVLFAVGGFYFGNIPSVKRNFQYVIIGIIVVSVLPAVVEFLRARAESKKTA